MATVYSPLLDEDKEDQKAQEGPALDQGTPLTSGSSSGISTSSQAGQPVKPSRSGQFTNIQNILAANKQGSQQLGQNISQKVGQQVESGLGQVEKSKQASLGQVQGIAGNVGQQQAQGRKAISNLFYGRDPNLDLGAQEATAKQGLDTAYQQQLQGSQFQNLQNLTQTKQNIEDIANQSRTSAGQQAILEKNFARPDYTKGQSSLDALLLGGNKEGQQGLARARQNAAQFNPALQKAQTEFGTQKGQTEQTLNNQLTALQGDIQRKIASGEDAEKDKSLYMRIQNEADRLNASRQHDVSTVNKSDMLQALNNAGYKVNSLSDMVKLPGTNIQVQASELAKHPEYFKESFQQANLQNVDPNALARLNVLNRLGNAAEILPGQELNTDIQRGLSTQGSGAIQNALTALKAQGLTNVQGLDLSGHNIDTNMIGQLAQQGLTAAGTRPQAVQLLQNLKSLPPEQLAKVMTQAGYGVNAKTALPTLQNAIQNANVSNIAHMDTIPPAIMKNVPKEDRAELAEAFAESKSPSGRMAPSRAALLKKYLPNAASSANPSIPGINESKLIKNVAQQQLTYNEQQKAINNILNKYLRGTK